MKNNLKDLMLSDDKSSLNTERVIESAISPSSMKSLYSIWDELRSPTMNTIELKQHRSTAPITPRLNKREEAKKRMLEKYGNYQMESEVFDYQELKESQNFGIKYYQNAIFRGELNEDN